MSNPYKKHYPSSRRTRENPQRYLERVSTGTRANIKDYHQQATLRGPMLGPDRRSKENPYHTDLAIFHKEPKKGKKGKKKGTGGTRRHRKSRGTRRH